jgi:hypothetical protein
MAQKARHRYHWPLTLGVALIVAASCAEAPSSAPPDPAEQGAVQSPSSGPTLSEDEACQRIRDAEEASRRLNQCSDLERAPCPFYVRPAGSGCWEFTADSVEACETAIAAYTTCFQFDETPCVLSARPSAESCPPSPIIGGGGAGGSGGSDGDGGTGSPAGGSPPQGQAGEGGIPGAAGSPEAPGGAAGAAPSAGAGGV